MKKIVPLLKIVNELFNGKKRAIGGIGYILIDILVSAGKLDPAIANQIKPYLGTLFGAGTIHAVKKALSK